MKWRIDYHALPELPKLAWLACLELRKSRLTAFHGPAVECHNEWLVEGVWDDDFEAGNFHRSENFFGSGFRIEGDRIFFVSSSALVDRLFHCSYEGKILVSNSLILLLAFTGARLDDNHDYRLESRSILNGIKNYSKDFTINHDKIEKFYQVYHSNIIIENNQLSYEMKSSLHSFGSYKQYYEFLCSILARIRANYETPKRKVPLSVFTTLSSGYDSTAVSSLVKRIGVRTCFIRRRSNSMLPSWISKSFAIDDGRPAADALGLETLYLDHRSSSVSDDELYFLAASSAAPELSFYSMADHIANMCAAAVVFTGYHGDKIWDANIQPKYLNDQIIRGDTSGLNLSEIRLKSGFINVAVPFILARNIENILKISLSPEMAPWRLNNPYDRPIPRRIAESSGIARQLFGIRKKAITGYYPYPKNSQLRKQFFTFLRRKLNIGPMHIYKYSVLNKLIYIFLRSSTYIKYFWRSRTLAISPITSTRLMTRMNYFRSNINTSYLMYKWSVYTLSEQTASVFRKHGVISGNRSSYHNVMNETDTTRTG